METLKEIRCVFYELEHEPTGARHIHIASEDRENTFGVAFKTVPEDSTGVPIFWNIRYCAVPSGLRSGILFFPCSKEA
jgi:hypothetical protein